MNLWWKLSLHKKYSGLYTLIHEIKCVIHMWVCIVHQHIWYSKRFASNDAATQILKCPESLPTKGYQNCTLNKFAFCNISSNHNTLDHNARAIMIPNNENMTNSLHHIDLVQLNVNYGGFFLLMVYVNMILDCMHSNTYASYGVYAKK